MKKNHPIFSAVLLFFLSITMIIPADLASAKSTISSGTVFKGKNHDSVYYLGTDGKRYVFPNANTFLSWYNDFNNVVEVSDQDLSQYPLAGNVRYRPGMVLVKIQTDPKVYAVSDSGVLQWVKSEKLAKELYGENWNLLVDDIPVEFFTNYRIGSAIASESDYDPEDEEDAAPEIDYDLGLKIQERIQNRVYTAEQKMCSRLERMVNRIQNRLDRRGIKLEIGSDFLSLCQNSDNGTPDYDDDNNYNGNKNKIIICHIPPGDLDNAHTIVVSKSAAKAHLAHGDTLGKCSGRTGDDNTAPVISNIQAAVNATSTVVTWTTDEKSKSAVEYASQSLIISTTTTVLVDNALLTAHSLKLTSLSPSTIYYYMVKSTDSSGNVATSTEKIFTTLAAPAADTAAPIISNIQAAASTTSTIITWTTNENSKSEVEFALQSLSTATSTIKIADMSLVTSHSINLTSLTPATAYYYMVKSTDANGNAATSTEKTFTTLSAVVADTAAPAITNILATPSTTSAIITWSTDENSSSKVKYATESLTTASSIINISDTALVTAHSVNLSGLATSTQYFYIIESHDSSSNLATSTEKTFITL